MFRRSSLVACSCCPSSISSHPNQNQVFQSRHGHRCLKSGTCACKHLGKNGLSGAHDAPAWNCDGMCNTSWHLQLTVSCVIGMWQWQLRGTRPFMEGVSTAEQLQPGHTSSNSMQSVRWSGKMYAATGLWRHEEVFSGVTNHVSGNLMDKSGFGGCQEQYTSDPAVPSVKFGGVVSSSWFQWKDLWILQHTKTFWTVHPPNFVGTVWSWPPSSSNMTVNQGTNQGPFPSNIIVTSQICFWKNVHTPKSGGQLSQKRWSSYICKGWTNVILSPMD